jgi:hypothetical protein
VTTQSKPRYPAVLFRHRHRYGARYCGHCGRRLTPRVKTGGRKPSLEPAPAFAKRKYCGYSCRSLAQVAVRASLKELPESSELSTLTDPTHSGPPAPENVAEKMGLEPDMVAEKPSMATSPPKDPRIGQVVRPVKLPPREPFKPPPVPPPSLQSKLPDPRPSATPFTVTEGEVLERADYGTCPTKGCGERLNAFGKCRNCEQRKHWLKGQRAKVGAA